MALVWRSLCGTEEKYFNITTKTTIAYDQKYPNELKSTTFIKLKVCTVMINGILQIAINLVLIIANKINKYSIKIAEKLIKRYFNIDKSAFFRKYIIIFNNNREQISDKKNECD